MVKGLRSSASSALVTDARLASNKDSSIPGFWHLIVRIIFQSDADYQVRDIPNMGQPLLFNLLFSLSLLSCLSRFSSSHVPLAETVRADFNSMLPLVPILLGVRLLVSFNRLLFDLLAPYASAGIHRLNTSLHSASSLHLNKPL